MKNMQVKMKLIVSFMIMIALAIVVGAVGIIGMSTINAADDELYTYNVIALEALGSIRENFVSLQRDVRVLVIRDSASPQYKAAQQSIETLEKEMQEYIALYTPTMRTQKDRDMFDHFLKYYQEYLRAINDMMVLTDQNIVDGAMDILDNVSTPAAEEVKKILFESYEYNVGAARASVNNNTGLFQRMAIIEIGVLLIAIAAAVFLIFYISGLIAKPLLALTVFMNRAGATGDISLDQKDIDIINMYSQSKDEVGQCIGSTSNFIKHLTTISGELETIANGDLTTSIEMLSEKDTMGVSMQKMVDNLNGMFGEINSSTAQVSTGAKQIADGAQSLAQGSTEQASSVEELSGSISEIAQKTKDNAEMAIKAAKLADTIKGSAEKGSHQMDEMMAAVQDINQASQRISKVIKVIDDIAFQTNILALNAAVEAARAGQHGKGFAVVAEEVRNLAGKSAEAAKDTGSMIADSMAKAELGARIASETAASLIEIVSGINESNLLVGSIARLSEEQSAGIMQINIGIDQVAQVVQQNSATAEESAAASQEMSGQADILGQMIAQFKLKEGKSGRSFKGLPPVGGNSGSMGMSGNASDAHGSNSSYGKY